jgi:hypothetical protein
LWSSDRPEFTERVAKLAGGTTYREPVGGYGTKSEHLPDAHAIAAALSFARRGPDDIGPDVAYCWVLQSDAYRAKVTRILADTICHQFRASREEISQAIGHAWEVMIWKRGPAARVLPAGKEWDALLALVQGVLYSSAWDSLAEAERRYKGH